MAKTLIQMDDEDDFFNKLKKIIEETIKSNVRQNSNSEQAGSPYISLSEACKMLKISRPTIMDWSSKKYLTAYKVNSRILFEKSELNQFVKNFKK